MEFQGKAFSLPGALFPYPASKKSLIPGYVFNVLERNRDSEFQMIFSIAVLLSRHVRSYNKKNGLFHQRIQTAEWFDPIF